MKTSFIYGKYKFQMSFSSKPSPGTLRGSQNTSGYKLLSTWIDHSCHDYLQNYLHQSTQTISSCVSTINVMTIMSKPIDHQISAEF